MSHYEVLGVDRHASPGEIRAAYHRQARLHHPDFHAHEPAAAQVYARRRMQEVNEAWRVLGHQARRAAYDRTLGRPGVAGGPFDGPPDGPGDGAGRARIWGLDPDEVEAEEAARWEERERWAPSVHSGRRRPLLVVPVLLLAAALGLAVVSLTTGLVPLLVLAAACAVSAFVLFVAAPLVVMVGAKQNE